ncbi:MAG: hypothetical protein KJ709_06900, partial [Nanoarchaeota archaeon]|nr:hypothetical protein [Nanoarchaeota archaeon]
DGNKTLFLNITDVLSNDWLLNVTVTLDNTKPSATMKIIPISQPGWENVSGEYTGSTTVVLNMTYSDLNSISRCRYYETAWTDWETCIPQRTFLLSGSDGLKTVIYEVRDTAGNINRTNDTITLNQTGGGLDITPPTSPIVVDDGNYTNSNSQLHAYWYNSTDRENELLAIDLDYEYRIYNGSAYIVNWTFTEGTEITKTGLSLRNGSNYTFEVKAINSVGLKSANATSDGIIADHDVPAAPIVNSSSHPSPTVWYGNSSATLNWSSGDSNSGIGAYSFILDTISTTIPDDIPEGTLNQLDQKITHLYTNLGDGTFYFHIKARDKADNWGSTTHFSFKIDTTSPSTPQLGPVGSYIGAGNTSFNWTMSSDLQSGVSNYYLQVSNRSDFNNTIYSAWVGNKTNQSLTISEATIYYAKVRSQNGAGLNSTYSNAISTVLDTQPPKLLFYKPSGTVISPTVILRVDTDEDATCRYRVTTPPGIWRNFSYTGETIHESRLTSLSTTSYAYTYSCYDAVGNENTTDITFTHSALAPTSITYVTAARGFTNSIVSFNVSVTSSGTGLGEIKKSSTSLRLNTHYPDYNMDDRGDGLYEISFRAPMNEGNYSMVFNVSGITGSSTAEILDISLGLTYRGGGLQASSSTHMAFSRQSNYLFGMASDSSSVSTSGTASQLTITANTADGKIYIFATDPGARVETREHLLKDRTFKDNVLQSFGRQIDADEQKVYTLLEYDDIMIRSDTNRAEELGPGVYNLVIRNTNITSGKTLIEVVT